MELISREMVIRKIVEIEQKIVKIEQQIDGLPKGELICAKNDERYKWYLKENGKRKYIPKKKRALAEALAEKKYYMYWLEELKNEVDIYKYYLKKYPDNKRTTDYLLVHKGWGELLKNRFKSTNLELQKWQNEEYISCTKHKENLVFSGTQGKKLRSKSEVIIDMLLYKYQIPFHYEERLVLNGIEVYPDFTTRHPVTGKVIYWEHYGMMDDEIYRSKVHQKMKIYCENGIIPSINLITTYETNDHPLNIDYIESIIKMYYL